MQVLRRWRQAPIESVALTLVVDRRRAAYSGMVPGLVAGDYRADELEIDVVSLARCAGARVVLAPARRIDPVARELEIEGHPPVAYDIASLDVGSTVRGRDVPGVREHALATRPIGAFIEQVEARVRDAAARAGRRMRIVVVGGGAAGVEIAFTLRARGAASGMPPEITLVSDDSRVPAGYPARVAARVGREADRRGIGRRVGARVTRVDHDGVVLGEEHEPCDLVVWATGAAPTDFASRSALPFDAAGFIRVRRTLQVEGDDNLFAVGDCASIADAPWVRKAGVYAVREGPVLDANLRALLAGEPLRRYDPQRDFLSLLNLGERYALGAKWGVVVVGRWVWHVKDRIDRRFVRRFQS